MPSTAGMAAAEGHAAHTLSELCRVMGHSARRYLGYSIEDHQYKFVVDEEMADGVQGFINYCQDEFGNPLIETRVSYEQWVPGGFGTMDDGRLTSDVLILTDLKWGVTDGEGSYGEPVSCVDNSQLKLYALGAYSGFRAFDYDIKKFVLRIYQPRLDHEDQWEISTKDLLAWANDVVRPAAKLALTPGAPFKAGPWCAFCKRRATCETRAKSAFAAFSGDFVNLDEPKAVAVIERKAQEVSALTGDQIAKILSVSKLIKTYLKDVEKHAIEMMKAGRAVGDYKFVESKVNRTYDPTMPQAVVAANLLELGISEDQLYSKKLITPPQAELILGKKNRRLAALIHKPTGRPKLAPGSNPKPAMAISAVAEFKDLGDADDEE